MPGIGPQTFIRQQQQKAGSSPASQEADKVTDCPFAVAPEKVVQRQTGGPFAGFKALENNADDPARFLSNRSRKGIGGNIRARRSCLTSARAVKIYAARVLWLRPPPENGKKFPSYLFFQAEANVVIFSKTLHVESNTVTVS